MNGLQIAMIILASFVLVGQILNIIVDILFVGWVLAFAWIATCMNIGISITLIVVVARNMSASSYRVALIFYYITDFLTLFTFIMFLVSGYFNWAKLVNFLLITPIIVVVHVYLCQTPIGVVSYDPYVQPQPYQQPMTSMTYQPAVSPGGI